jgi:hypothetical protein
MIALGAVGCFIAGIALYREQEPSLGWFLYGMGAGLAAAYGFYEFR